MPAPKKPFRDLSFADQMKHPAARAALALSAMLVALAFILPGLLDSDDSSDYSDWEPYLPSVTCPEHYENAGQSFEYDQDEVLSTWDKVVNDQMNEWRLARERVIEENCGKLRETSRAENPGIAAAEREQAKADREAGFHCLSAWDGNFNNLEALIRRQLHDPDSMETVSTRIAPAMDNGKHPVEVVFRATNQYGAVVTVTALGSAHSNSCIAELFSIGDQIFADAGYSHEIFGIIE